MTRRAGPHLRRACALLLLLWCVASWTISAQSDPESYVGVRLFLNDKVVHFLQYAAGGFLAAGALVGGAGRRTWLAGVLFAFLWGASDEYHQSFVPGRDATVLDLMADVAGGAAGALVLTYAVRRRGTPSAEPSPGVAATKEQNPT